MLSSKNCLPLIVGLTLVSTSDAAAFEPAPVWLVMHHTTGPHPSQPAWLSVWSQDGISLTHDHFVQNPHLPPPGWSSGWDWFEAAIRVAEWSDGPPPAVALQLGGWDWDEHFRGRFWTVQSMGWILRTDPQQRTPWDIANELPPPPTEAWCDQDRLPLPGERVAHQAVVAEWKALASIESPSFPWSACSAAYL
jgi:hypothetical protein